MINAISGYSPYTYGIYGPDPSRAARALSGSRAVQSGVVTTARKIHQPETPVQPVTPVRAVSGEDPAQAGLLRYRSDPAEMAVRMRIEYPGDNAWQGAAAGNTEEAPALTLPGSSEGSNPALGLPGTNGEAVPAPALPETGEESNPVPGLPGSGEEAVPALTLPGARDDGSAQQVNGSAPDEAQSAQEVMEEGECQTCKERKYQDGSNDPGVSFKTPTNIAPERAASAVRGHELEHVVREQAKARQEGRKVVSQSVTYHTAICPECGKVYVSGGTTRTVTRAGGSQQAEDQNQNQNQQNPRIGTFALV